jgi:hypothetical protein
MLILVVQRMAEALASQPDPVLPAARIGTGRPSAGAEVPALTIAVVVDAEHLRGLGRELRLDKDGREVLRGDVYSGLLELEAWAQTASALDQLTVRLQRRLTVSAEPARERGFLRLQPTRLDPAEQLLRQPAVGSAFAVWRQQLSYRFTCQLQEAPLPSDAGLIQRVDVGVGDGVVESFSVPDGHLTRRPSDG